jgi:hypothetical protein
MNARNQETDHESDGIGEENLPQVQDRAPQAGGSRHLLRPAPQAAAGLKRPRGKKLDKALSRQV